MARVLLWLILFVAWPEDLRTISERIEASGAVPHPEYDRAIVFGYALLVAFMIGVLVSVLFHSYFPGTLMGGLYLGAGIGAKRRFRRDLLDPESQDSF